MTKNLPWCLLLAGLTYSSVWANEPIDLSKEKSIPSTTNRVTTLAGEPIPANIRLSARGFSRNSIIIKWDQYLYFDYSGGTYTLERAKAADGIYTRLTSDVIDADNIYADNGLQVGTAYIYRFTVYFEGNTYYQIVTASTEAEVSEPAAKVLSNQRYGGTGNDQLMSMIRTSDGGYLLAGNSNSASGGDKTDASQGGVDFWIVKTNASGTKLWDKRYGGSGDDLLVEVLQTSDGGYMLAGSSNSGISGDKSEASRGGLDYWVVKISANGTKQWDKTFGGTAADYVGRQEYTLWYYSATHSGASVIVQTADGGYLLGGTSLSSASGDKSEPTRDTDNGISPGDYWVVKMSDSGVKQWDKTVGGEGLEEFASLIKTSDGSYLIGGNSTSLPSGEKSESSGGDVYRDFWLVKLGTNGALLWEKTLRVRNESLSLAKMIPTADGGYLLGSTQTGLFDVALCYESNGKVMAANCLMKITSSGVIQWTKVFHGNLRNSDGSRYDDILNTMIQTQDGGFLLSGTSTSMAGNNGVNGNSGSAFIKSETVYGQAYATACDYALTTYVPSKDYWVIKVDSTGNHLWNKDLGGFGADDLQAILQNPDGSYLLAGSSNSGADGDKTQPSQGGNDFWLVKLQGTPTTVPVATSKVRINCGGSDFKVANGLTFKADAYFSGLTKTSLTGGEIAGTVNDALYYTDRVADVDKGTFQYQIPVTNGKYQVNLFLAETYFTAPGKRVMSVKAEGNPILTNYDIFAAQGKRTAKMLSYIVTVNDGNVTLDFSATVNRPKINAIEVVPASASAAREEASDLDLAATSLLQVAPNPFSDKTTLRFQLEQTQAATLQLYDLQGQPLRTLFRGEVEAGVVQQVELESAGLPAGVYLVRLVTAHQVSHVKLILQH